MESVRKEALARIRAHISDASICLITSNILEWSLRPEALSHQCIDDEGKIWFLYSQEEIDPALSVGSMEVFYSNREKGIFLSLLGDFECANLSEVDDLTRFNLDNSPSKNSFRLAIFSAREAFYWNEVSMEMVPIALFDEAHDQMVA